MLTYDLEKRKGIPKYTYLYTCIKNDIWRGILKPGEKLPSKRELAVHLNISVITVENAYSQLIDEGYITAIEKKGYYIDTVEIHSMPEVRRNVRTEKPDKSENMVFVDFVSNKTDPEDFPFSVWAGIMRRVMTDRYEQLLEAVPAQGSWELREAISKHLYDFRGMEVIPENIVIGAGCEYLYYLITRLIGNDKIFALEEPGHAKIQQIYTLNGIKCRTIDPDRNGIDTDVLNKTGSDILHISPSHHFPSGMITPIGQRYRLLKWAQEGERYIIEDDYDSEFRFNGKPIPSLKSIDYNNRVIYVNTFSKTISPALRIGYMVLPPALMSEYHDKMPFLSCAVPVFEQYTLAEFIANGKFEQHISRMKKRYRIKRDILIESIKSSKFYSKVTIEEENAGLHFILKIKTEKPDSEIKRIALKEGIKLSFISDYVQHSKEKYEHQAVINYSGVKTERIEEAVHRIEKAFC